VTLSELLNTDLTTVGRWLRAGLEWWMAELAGMLPAPMRRLVEARHSLTAEPSADGRYRLTRGGRLVMESGGSSRRPRAVTLRLPREAALIRLAPAPALPERDLRRMLALDIDRLTPFRPDQVFVDVALSDAAPGEASLRLAIVAAIPRQVAARALDQARAAGLDPRALGVVGGSPAELTLDFLPKMREAGVAPRPRQTHAVIWGLIAVLVVANLGAAIARDMLDVKALREQIDAQQPRVSLVQALRRKVLSEDHRRADILARRESGEPLRMLSAVTQAIPGGAWVDRLAWNGQSVRLSGYRQDQVDVAAALRSAPLLTNVRNSGSDVLSRQAAGQPFDLTADLKKPGGG
jgi:general secretion pathway protein L